MPGCRSRSWIARRSPHWSREVPRRRARSRDLRPSLAIQDHDPGSSTKAAGYREGAELVTPGFLQRRGSSGRHRQHELEVLAAAEGEVGPGAAEVGPQGGLDGNPVEPDLDPAGGHLADPLELDDQPVADVTPAADPTSYGVQTFGDPWGGGELRGDPGAFLAGEVTTPIEEQPQSGRCPAERPGDKHEIPRSSAIATQRLSRDEGAADRHVDDHWSVDGADISSRDGASRLCGDRTQPALHLQDVLGDRGPGCAEGHGAPRGSGPHPGEVGQCD